MKEIKNNEGIQNFLKLYNQDWDKKEKSKQEFVKASKEFIKTIAKLVGAEAKKITHTNFGNNRGEVSGFLKKGKNWVYILISDVPAFKKLGILFKQVDSPKDTKGWINNYVKPDEEGIDFMIRQIRRILNT